jgi:hypothetical protein
VGPGRPGDVVAFSRRTPVAIVALVGHRVLRRSLSRFVSRDTDVAREPPEFDRHLLALEFPGFPRNPPADALAGAFSVSPQAISVA